MNVGKLIGYDQDDIRTLSGERYGVEIEVERAGRHPDIPGNSLWRVKDDGSLRNEGAEFYFSRGAEFDEAVRDIQLWYRWRDAFKYVSNVRTGIHVHVNCIDSDIEAVGRRCALYAVLEPAFYALGGGDVREQNTYCVPWYRNSLPAQRMRQSMDHPTKRMHFRNLAHTNKYVGLNVGSLPRLGTVEFRHARTFEEEADTLLWLGAIRGTIQLADSMDSVSHIIAEAADPDMLLYTAFGVRAADKVIEALGCSMNEAVDKYDSLAAAYTLREPVAAQSSWEFPPSAKEISSRPAVMLHPHYGRGGRDPITAGVRPGPAPRARGFAARGVMTELRDEGMEAEVQHVEDINLEFVEEPQEGRG